VTSGHRPAAIPAAVWATCAHLLPRLLFLQSRFAPQVHWGDVALVLQDFPTDDLDLASAEFWREWGARWEARGDAHARVARASSTAAGRARAARGAAACYHWAEFMDFDDGERKSRLRRRVREWFEVSASGSGLRIERGELPADDPGPGAVPYWLLWPSSHEHAAGPLPCVIMSNGLDSMTEVEVLALAEAYLDRGIAALLFDGPGQGIQVGRTALRVDMEAVVSALLARLRDDARIASGRLAFLGISFGGYFALRLAQALGPSFRCVVNLSGGPRVAPFASLPRRLKEDFRFVLSGGDAADMQARFDALALDPARPPGTDVLSIHGALDDIFPLAGLRELNAAWGGRHRLVVHESERHACLNVIDTCSLEAADWVAGRLQPAFDQPTHEEERFTHVRNL
jgi:pimeloyl-ACP methyl ester carboxylesterase